METVLVDVRPEDRLTQTARVLPALRGSGTVSTAAVSTTAVSTTAVPTGPSVVAPLSTPPVPLDLEDRDPRPPRDPDRTGVAVRDGVRLPYAVHGAEHTRTVVLLPTWTILPARVWKLQVPALARHARVVTFEGRGGAAGDRPAGTAAYRRTEFAEDTVAVMDAAGVDHALLVGFSMGAPWAVRAAAGHPDRVDALLLIAGSGTGVSSPGRALPFDARPAGGQGWDLYNRPVWLVGGW
ncbi:MAG TPA: alpha/beta fold hydrolase, partial [Ornithinimicrobium sp.]|nr:alpha/beta fold hydrolase [Ornithinimicrobium sp.]